MRATYCPEDNKLRIYPEGTRVDSVLDETEYAEFKRDGYKWASKQECFVAPRWTPAAEDWAFELCGDIEDEDYSPEERAADRAERFAGYRDNRRDGASSQADTFEAGPSAFGHQNRQRAERAAARHDRYRVRALSQWGKAEYWQTRTQGVIRNALHRSKASVRRGRILEIEKDLRKLEKSTEQSIERQNHWRTLLELEGLESPLPMDENDWVDVKACSASQQIAYAVANTTSSYIGSLWHPRSEEANAKAREIWSHGFSPYDLMCKSSFAGVPMEQLSPREVATMVVEKFRDPRDPESGTARWLAHYNMRLIYENAMLENEGGKAADVEMEPGGWIGKHQIQKVNKSSVTGRVVSVQVWGTTTGYTKESGYTKQETRPCLKTVNIERCGSDVYRAPTDEERAAFAEQKKASKKPPVSTINPTDDDAERLQTYLNKRAALKAKEKGKKAPSDREVERTTQARYSSYGSASGVYSIDELTFGDVTFKVRLRNRGWDYDAARGVVVLTDKPQKPIPIDWDAAFASLDPQPVVPAEPAEPVPAGQLF